MDPSRVLLALEEQKKWQERHERIQERIHQLDRKRVTLTKELDRVRKKIGQVNRAFSDLGEARIHRTPAPPIVPGR